MSINPFNSIKFQPITTITPSITPTNVSPDKSDNYIIDKFKVIYAVCEQEQEINWNSIGAKVNKSVKTCKEIAQPYFDLLMQSPNHPLEWTENEHEQLLLGYWLCCHNRETRLLEPYIWENVRFFLPNRTGRECRQEFYRLLKYAGVHEKPNQFEVDWIPEISKLRQQSIDAIDLLRKPLIAQENAKNLSATTSASHIKINNGTNINNNDTNVNSPTGKMVPGIYDNSTGIAPFKNNDAQVANNSNSSSISISPFPPAVNAINSPQLITNNQPEPFIQPKPSTEQQNIQQIKKLSEVKKISKSIKPPPEKKQRLSTRRVTRRSLWNGKSCLISLPIPPGCSIPVRNTFDVDEAVSVFLPMTAMQGSDCSSELSEAD